MIVKCVFFLHETQETHFPSLVNNGCLNNEMCAIKVLTFKDGAELSAIRELSALISVKEQCHPGLLKESIQDARRRGDRGIPTIEHRDRAPPIPSPRYVMTCAPHPGWVLKPDTST